MYSFVFAALSVKYVFSREYWAGLTADHVPETLHFVMKKYEAMERAKKI